MRRILVGVWGKDASKYVGRSLTLYRDPTVAFGGLQVGGIRVSHMSDISEDKTVALLVTRGRKAPFKIKPLVKQQSGDDEQATALQALTEAAANGTEALGNVWKQKWLAPHREALQIDLERLKAVAAKHDAAEATGATKSENQAETSTERPSFNMADEINRDDEHPGKAKAAEMIAAIEGMISVMDVNSFLARHKEDIEAMPDGLGVSVEVAADKRRKVIEAERQGQGSAREQLV